VGVLGTFGKALPLRKLVNPLRSGRALFVIEGQTDRTVKTLLGRCFRRQRGDVVITILGGDEFFFGFG
jgi:hypothetical protein